MKIIIYGLGSGRLNVEKYLNENHEIIGYSDSFFKGEMFNDKTFYEPKELLKVKFDYIVIAIGSLNIYTKIKNYLINIGMEKEKITCFYREYELFKALNNKGISGRKEDQIMKTTNENFEGIILGISHSEAGIMPKYLDKNFLMISRSSHDLFYNLKNLEYVIKKYPERIKDLKYAILDMYTYTYFNYDVSMGKDAANFINGNGFTEVIHNLNLNNNYNKSLFEFLFNINMIKSDFNILDKQIVEFDITKIEDRTKNLTHEEIRNFEMSKLTYTRIQSGDFFDTQKENIDIFESILKRLNEINSKIKIYIVLIPQHKVVEDRLKIIEKEWKYSFYNILNTLKEKYNFEILDFKDSEEISSKNEYYYDLGHLNYNGAIAFTKMLNSYMY